MSNQSNGRKKSQFNAQASVPSGSYFDFVYNGQNYRVLDTDLYASLGVTGTLAQAGDPTAIPVLNTAGSVNEIRNIEPGSGVSASVSPQNGVTIKHNFTANSDGVPVLIDETETSPIVRSIQAGSGVNVSASGGEIIISASETPVSTKTVVVNELSDFPDAVTGVRTLLPDTEYLMTNDIDIGTDRLVLSDSTALKGTESILITLTYTGSGDMLTMVDSTNRVANLTISCANGRVFNWTNSTAKILRVNDVTITSCDQLGILSATDGIVRFTNVTTDQIASSGIEFTGNFRFFLFEVSATSIDAGALFNLGTATFDSFIADTVLLELNGSSNLLSGAAASANINAEGSGLVETMRTSGTGTPLSGITTDDTRWVFTQNDDIPDTRLDALISIQGNATETVIATIDVPVKMAGTWVVGPESYFEGDTTGRMTFVGEKNARLPVDATITTLAAAGGDKIVSAYIAINGVVVSETKKGGTASSSKPASITMIWQHTFVPGDYVEVFLENNQDTTNLIGQGGVGRIN